MQPSEKWVQKKPELLPQVHEQHNGEDQRFAGLLQFGYDAVQGVPPLGCTKSPLDLAALSGFLCLINNNSTYVEIDISIYI